MQYMQVAVEGSKRQVLSVVRLKVAKTTGLEAAEIVQGTVVPLLLAQICDAPDAHQCYVVGTVQKKSKSFITHVENILRQAKSERHPY